MTAFERYWLAPIPAVRPWLFFKATLLLFGLDAFREHLRPAWRYGAAGFNVAHFAILDALPIPSSAFYVGVMTALGLASFVCALVPRPRRALIAFVAIAYFWSWSCSMHDSYQHHYLLSLFFLAFAFFPLLSSRDLFGVPGDLERTPVAKDPSTVSRKGAKKKAAVADVPPTLDAALPHGLVPRASAWAMTIVWSTAAIVYAYTAYSKTEAEWIGGDALRNITRDGQHIPGAVDLFAAFGIEGDALWPFLGVSTVALQIGCSLGYATAPLRDRITHRPGRIVLEIVAWVALALSLSFHLGAEYMGLEIGWFSWYMILLALATFVPARALGYVVLFATWPLRQVSQQAELSERAGADSPIGTAILAAITGAILLPAGTLADLPGALPVCVAIGVALMAASVVALVRKEGFAEVRAVALAVLLGAACMLAMLRMGPDVRYDYWRFAGGDFRRRGEWQLALDAYEHANHYAPRGQSRDRQITEMRERIRTEGPRRTDP